MNLFPKWTGNITIPSLPYLKTRIGDNLIHHSPTLDLETKATLQDSSYKGHDLLQTKLPYPFNEFYVRRKGARKLSLDKSVLFCPDDVDCEEWNRQTNFIWDDSEHIYFNFCTPQKILDSWPGKFIFQVANEEKEYPGLRAPQIGALHAISAHFAVGQKFDEATIVLPTGTGKTETMLASLVYNRPDKLLVLVPSDALRTQITRKFLELGILRQLFCIPQHTVNPKVAIIKKGIKSAEEAEHLVSECNVIVALPNTLEVSNPEAVERLCELCSDLVVDEAHHVTANTWQKVKDHFRSGKITQFTATPFRRDRKHIGGKIIFNYKLSDAQNDGYYKPIRLETVEEFGEEVVRDHTIAERAVSILREDLLNGNDHLIMARVKSTNKVDEIVSLYRNIAPEFNPVCVYSGSGRTVPNHEALLAIRGDGEIKSRIVICVDMLGEGFDLPELKIAAIHENHKSLAITLQFIGRFTRKAENVGDAAVIINIADAKAETSLENLYSEGADWDHLISRLSEDKIEGELQLQDVIEDLKTSGTLHEKISLWNLYPTLSTQIYKTRSSVWNPDEYLSVFSESSHLWHSIGKNENVLIVVGYLENSVKWGRYEDLIESSYELLIAYLDEAKGVLFMHSSDYDLMKVQQVAKAITSDDTELLNGQQIFRILNGVELPLAKSLGSSRIGAISFTSYFGPNVTEGLASVEISESELNNIVCLGYENGDKVVWGGAQRKGKIWQQRGGSIDDWMKWCQNTYAKVSDETGDKTNITRDFLRPKKMISSHEAHPISIQWGEYIQTSYSDNLAIIFGNVEVPLYQTDLEILESDDPNSIRFALYSDNHRTEYSFRISPESPKGYEYELQNGEEISFRISKKTVRDFQEQMYVDPLIIRYGDGTFSYNNFHIPIDLGASDYSSEKIEVWDWEGIPINRESMGKNIDAKTIQYLTFQKVKDEFSIIFNDDGPGEAGDLVAIKDVSADEIRLCLIHCKNAKGGKPSGDISNLYTVCGQAQKSIAVKHEGLKKLSVSLRRRHEIWAKEGYTRILKGDLRTLAYFVEKSRKARVTFEVIIVQPGLSKSNVSSEMAKLLATTELFLKRTTEAEFRVIGSE